MSNVLNLLRDIRLVVRPMTRWKIKTLRLIVFTIEEGLHCLHSYFSNLLGPCSSTATHVQRPRPPDFAPAKTPLANVAMNIAGACLASCARLYYCMPGL